MAITKLGHMKESSRGNPGKHLKNAIHYILNPDKTEKMVLTGGNSGYTPDEIYQTFLRTKQLYEKPYGRQGYHYIISFKPGEASEEQVYKLMKRWCEEYLKDNYDYVFALHNDHEHIHGHVIFNSVSRIDGYKYRYKKDDWKKTIQPVTDQLCEQMGLPKLTYTEEKKGRKHYAEWKAEKERNPTFSDIMRADIDAAVSKAIDYKDFLWNMELMGYQIREGYSQKRGEPYLTFYTEGMKRGHRNYTLGREYALSKLKKRIQEKSNVSAVYQKKTLRYSPILKITGNRYVSYTRQSVFYITGLQFRYLKRAYRAKHIHSPYAVRGERYRKDICRVHQLSEQCGYLIRHKIYHIKQLERQQTDLKNQKQQMKKSGEEEQMKMLQAELRIVNRILRETKESAVREKQLNLSGTVVKENTTRKRKGNYAKRGNKSISG